MNYKKILKSFLKAAKFRKVKKLLKYGSEADFVLVGKEFYKKLEDLMVERVVLYQMLADYQEGIDPLAEE